MNSTIPSTVEWRDLVPMSTAEKCWEIALPLPWLMVSLWCYATEHLALGAVGSYYFFLTGLRQSHGAQHYSLGMGRRFQDVVLFALSVCMGASMHAVQASHLHHHQHCLAEEDTEGATARLPWWQALLIGPLFLCRMHQTAWRLSSTKMRLWIAAELVAVVAVVLTALSIGVTALQWHVSAMIAGECLTGFFAVWIVHHDCEPGSAGRTQRGRWLNWLCYDMLFHAEHHLYPRVPTCHLHILARRLDAAVPGFAADQVLDVISKLARRLQKLD
jgi:fatty acid desaturase